MRTHPSQMLETLHKGAEFKMGLVNLSSQLEKHIEEAEPQPKKHRTQLVPQQAQVLEVPVSRIEHIPQQVLKVYNQHK